MSNEESRMTNGGIIRVIRPTLDHQYRKVGVRISEP